MTTADSRRQTIEIESSGERLAAAVYGAPAVPAPGVPTPDTAASSAPAPAVLICTGFSGTQDTPSIVAAAEAFAAAGWIAMTFDYRSFGSSSGTPRQVVSVPGQLADIRAALAYLRTRPDVDSGRVALWGSSLGGGHVITIAAGDPAIAGVVAQVPFNGFPKRADREAQSTKAAYALLWAAIRDRVRGWTGRQPLYVKAVAAPGEQAVMASQGASQTIAALRSETWRNQVAPRGLLDMMFYQPGKHVGRVRAPLLVCVGEFDRETQGASTDPLARDAPRGELRSYPVAHFDIYHPEIREQVLADQVDFLRRAFAEVAS